MSTETYLTDLLRSLGPDSPFWLPMAPDFPEARCLHDYPDLWFPGGFDSDNLYAGIRKRVEESSVNECYECPHMIDCGNYAVSNRIEYGIWGGLTQEDRETIWAQEDAEAAA